MPAASYELTGPRLMTFADAAAELAPRHGREIEYVPITIDEIPRRCAVGGRARRRRRGATPSCSPPCSTVATPTSPTMSSGSWVARPATSPTTSRGRLRTGVWDVASREDGVMVTWQRVKVAAAVGAGTAGGVFFAFSTFVMRALDRLPPAHSLAAMQAINKDAPNPLFMAALFGTAAGARR